MGIECPKRYFESPDDTTYCGKHAAPLLSFTEIPFAKIPEIPKEGLNAGFIFAGRYRNEDTRISKSLEEEGYDYLSTGAIDSIKQEVLR